jgi:alpha-amylase
VGVIRNSAASIKAGGFTMVWLPPPSDAASSEGYLPRRLELLDSRYGTRTDLISALSMLNANGVRPIADVVINHRVGTASWADFTMPTWGSNAVCRGDEWSGATGSPETGDGYSAARDIDHTQTYVQDSIVKVRRAVWIQ